MPARSKTLMNVEHIWTSRLCMQCGMCVPMCPSSAIGMKWDARRGSALHIAAGRCTDCGRCLQVCPGAGMDFTAGAWWRGRNQGAPAPDFLGPWRALWFGWAANPRIRHAGASGGVATALLQGMLDADFADVVIGAGLSSAHPLMTRPLVARTAEEVSALRGSKYNVIPMNLALRTVLDEPARYVFVGLPCHVQALRLAQRRCRRLRERVVLALGIFCGFTNEPRGTALIARRAGLDPRDLSSVSYRGPGWPGVLRLESRSGDVCELAYPDYHDAYMTAHVPPRCRVCPDALAELADVSVGDAWLGRFTGSDGVNDVIARTPAGERFIRRLGPEWLKLSEASPEDVIASQHEAYRSKRLVGRGRRWWRAVARRAVPEYPGIPYEADAADRLAALRDVARETWFRTLADLRYR